MNLNNEEEDSVFNQHCLELAKLLRTEQTEDFLHLYDSLPSEWNGLREYLQLETAKEYIRQLQELDENEFELTYQRAFQNGTKIEQHHQTIIMSNLPIQSAVIRNNDNDGEQTITANSQITSVSFLQQKQHNERITANNLACDEKHDLSSKRSSSIKKNNDEFNTKTRRLQSITNNNTHDIIQNNCRTRTPVDSFVQLNLKPSSIDIRLEDYKKARDPMSATQTSSINNRSSIPQSIDANKLNQQGIIQSNISKKSKTSTTNKSHEEASFDYFFKNDDDPRQHSRSRSSSSSSTHNKSDLSINQILSQSNSCAHSKLIENNDFDSHGSSIATKSSSENSGSARTGSGSDSDDEHHHHHHHQCEKKPILSTIKSSLSSKDKSFNYDDTPTIVLNKTSDNRTNQNDRLSSLPVQNSYELVKLNSNDEHPLLYQVPRLKQPVTDEPNGINNSNNDILPHTTPRSQQNNLSSSSHQNRNSERHEPNNTNHSNSSRKLQNRPSKKRKQSQQQEIIRTELIPGHRGDLDVDELVMFIDGNSSSKQQQQRQNSAPLRPTDTNSNNTNSTSRRKSRKPIKILQETINNNENKTSQIDEDTQSIGFIDEDDQTTTTTTTHSLNNTYNEQISLPNDDDESYSNTIDIDSNTTNGEVFLPEWHSTSPPNDDIDLLSLSSTTLNNSNSEIISEPFVTVTHRRRSIKERRQDNNNNNNLSSRTSRLLSSSNINDKRRFQSGISTQNGILRPTIQNSLSNIKPFVSTTTKEEENTNIISPPLPVSQTSQLPSTSISNNLPEQSSPRLSSHSSSSSLSSLLKRQSKAPPVVFLNKSIDIELNDVSFGFDIENSPSDKPSTPPLPSEPSIEKEINPSSNDLLTNSKSSYSRRSYQQRNSRGPLFYSGSDIRPHHHRNYPSQIPVSQSSYIDPLVLLQYNQQYYQQLAYMNLLRSQYLSSQSQYVFIPTKSTYETNQDEKNLNDETSEQIQEPLLVYTTLPNQTGGPIYYHSTKKSFNNFDQSSIYPSQYFYPTHSAYFQPISSLLIDNKSQQDDTDHDDDEEDNNYEKSTKFFHQTSQQSSSHIMSNALHLVYSQEKRNAQTDRFNLDQLTGYLAMKWTDTIDHYEQGDDEILLVSEQE